MPDSKFKTQDLRTLCFTMCALLKNLETQIDKISRTLSLGRNLAVLIKMSVFTVILIDRFAVRSNYIVAHGNPCGCVSYWLKQGKGW